MKRFKREYGHKERREM
jgi:hypothetical protein